VLLESIFEVLTDVSWTSRLPYT